MSLLRHSLRQRLSSEPPLLLDAAMGTELDRRGVSTALPLWSARALIERPEIVREIHADNLRAGADIITATTFRTTSRTLRAAGLDPSDAERLTKLAVQLAHEARDETDRQDALIAGSIAPLEDCYSPWLTPPEEIAQAEHRQQAAWLAEAGVDVLMIETMPTITESAAALAATLEPGLPVTVGLVCQAGARPDEPVRLLSGETLALAVERLLPYRPMALLVNCSPLSVITQSLSELRQLSDLPIGGYANLGAVDPVSGWAADDSVSGAAYAAAAATWLDLGARIVGGCCGTTIRHTAALRTLLDQSAARSSTPLTTSSK